MLPLLGGVFLHVAEKDDRSNVKMEGLRFRMGNPFGFAQGRPDCPCWKRGNCDERIMNRMGRKTCPCYELGAIIPI